MCAMMTADDATRALLQHAQEIHAARMAALEPLAETLAKRKALQEQLDALDEEYGQRYVAAEKAGWSEDELTAMDAPSPTRRPRGRPAKKSTAAKRAASKTAATGSDIDRDKVPGQATPPGTEKSASDSSGSLAATPASATT